MTGPAQLVVGAWPVLVVAAGWRWGPSRTARVGDGPNHGTGKEAVLPGAIAAAVGVLGGCIRRLGGRAPEPEADRTVGLVVAASAGLALIALPLAVAPPLVAWAVPRARQRAARRSASAAVADELPQIVDLFVLAVGAGLTVALAIGAVARRASGPVARALAEADRAIALGLHPADALEAVATSVGDSVRPLTSILVSAERYGTPLVDPLERVAADVRLQRRRHAEEAARRVPVKLLFPLVLCTLPAFALLTVVPLLISALGSLRL